MALQYETGHAKNVANLQKLIEQITTYSNYNPSIDNLKITAITTLYNTALESLNNVINKRNANKNAIHLRQELYESLKPKATRIINQLDILNLTDGVFEQAKSINHLIQGSKRTNKTTKLEENNSNQEETETKETKSTSRQSYTETAESLNKLLQLIETIETYNPNIEDLKLVNLKIYQENLVKATKEVNKTEAELKTELISRNKILYNENNGLYEIAQNSKKYVKSVYGASSPEYKNVSSIKFTDLSNK
jgi:signal transduction histidine kinase